MRCLAFDLGASGGKLFSGQFDGRRLALQPVHAFVNEIVQLGDALYWDFPLIWSNLLGGLRRARADGAIGSIGIDGFNNDFSFVDARGELLFPVRSYRDPRTVRLADAIYARMPPEQLYRLSGNQIAPFNTYMQLAAMVESEQDYLFRHAQHLLMLPDLLMYFLSGERAIEYTLAAETQMLDLGARRWLGPVLAAIDFPERLLPPLVEPGTVLGAALAKHELGAAACVTVCEHDTASAFLAAPIGADAAILSAGTWALLGAETDGPRISEYGFRHNIANEGGPAGHHRVLKNVMGLWILQELLRDFRLDGRSFGYDEVSKLALAAPPFRALIDVDDARFFAPGDMRRKIRDAATQRGFPAPDAPGEYFRIVYEGLSLKYRHALEQIEGLLGRRFAQLNIIGGGSRDDVACRFACNAVGRPVLAGPADATALGNVMMQLIAHGEVRDIAEGRAVIRESTALRSYEPRDTEIWDEQYARFRQMFS